MGITFNPIMGNNNSIFFGKKEKKNPYGPIDRPLSRDELIIKRTKESIYLDAALGILATCLIYFKVKKVITRHSVHEKAIERYRTVRVGQPPERPKPLEFSKLQEHLKEQDILDNPDVILAVQKHNSQELKPKIPPKQTQPLDYDELSDLLS